jgi:hypothetical protein
MQPSPENRTQDTQRARRHHDGRKRSMVFENLLAAERFSTLLGDRGPEARRMMGLDELGHHVPTVTNGCITPIDNLAGVQPAGLRLGFVPTYVGCDVSCRAP